MPPVAWLVSDEIFSMMHLMHCRCCFVINNFIHNFDEIFSCLRSNFSNHSYRYSNAVNMEGETKTMAVPSSHLWNWNRRFCNSGEYYVKAECNALRKTV